MNGSFAKHYGWLIAAGALAMALALWPRISGLDGTKLLVRLKFPFVKNVSTSALAAWIADTNRPTPQIIDVRTVPEFAVSHLPEARQLDFDLPGRMALSEIDTNRAVVAYCSVGYRSSAFVSRLQSAGFKSAYNLQGSIFAWATEGRPLEANGHPVKQVHPVNADVARLLPSELRSELPPDDASGSRQSWLTNPQRSKMLLSFAVLFLLLLWETMTPFFHYFSGGTAERAQHAIRNFTLGGINAIFTSLLFVGLWLWASDWAETRRFGLLHWIPLPAWLQAVAALVLLDCGMYWWHRVNHVVPLLWRFHRMHHSDRQMDVTSAHRFHLGEIAMSALLRIVLILLLGIELWQIVIYEAAMFTVVQFHHANISVGPLDRVLNWFIVTPNMHRIHHSHWQPETDSNYASLLSCWDRVFGSFRQRDDQRNIQLGLDEFQEADQHTLTGMLATPLTTPRDSKRSNQH